MIKAVEKQLLNKIKCEGIVHMTLIDPEHISSIAASKIAHDATLSGTCAIMIGGSTCFSQTHLDNVVTAVKQAVTIPVILFPNNITGISPYADAVWFLSLLNSIDPYFLIGVHVLGAPIIKKHGLEPLPLGYIILGHGGTASVVGKAIPIPYDKPELVAAHALAGQYLGMRFIYLEAGSGAQKSVPPEVIRAVKNAINVPLIVGGGITTKKQAFTASTAGANILVTGNIVEKAKVKQNLSKVISGIQEGKKWLKDQRKQ